jgi:hypothetical protein
MASLAFAAARLRKSGPLRAHCGLQLRTAYLESFVRHTTHEKKS